MATPNARGIQIGTAEIYSQLGDIAEIAGSVAVGPEWEGDTRIAVQLRPSTTFYDALAERIRRRIRDNLSPRHVPARIVAVPEFPLIVTGKVSEIAVHSAIHGRAVSNRDALANPQALLHFAPERLPEIAR